MNYTQTIRYSDREEFLNSLTHGIGAALGAAATVAMVTKSLLANDTAKISASLIYGISLIVLYLASSIYHATRDRKAKEILRVFDHCSIFLLIAGTYTPFVMITLPHKVGLYLGIFIWATAAIGIVLNAISIEKFKILSMVFYIGMGWAVILSLKSLIASLPFAGIMYLLFGGIAYTAGTIFYGMKNTPYMHCVWHLFVLLGSILQFICVYNYVL